MKRREKIISGINAIIKKTKCKELKWYGIDYSFGPLWWLSGITPVGVEAALGILKTHGVDTAPIDKLFAQQEAEKKRRWDKKCRLRESAKKKLTRAEIAACDL